MTKCNFYWGSHGCDLDAGDHRIHQCGAYWEEHYNIDYEDMVDADMCCQYDEDADEAHRVRWAADDEGTWDDWGPYGEGWRQELHKFATGGPIKNSDFTIPVRVETGYIIPASWSLKKIDWTAKMKEWKTYFETEYKASLNGKIVPDILIKPTEENGDDGGSL